MTVTGGRVWVLMGAYGYIGVGEHGKQTCKGTYASNTHDFPGTMAGKFPKICVWVVGDVGGNGRSCMVTGWFATMQ